MLNYVQRVLTKTNLKAKGDNIGKVVVLTDGYTEKVNPNIYEIEVNEETAKLVGYKIIGKNLYVAKSKIDLILLLDEYINNML